MPERVTAGNSAHLHFIFVLRFDTEQGEYWVYLEVDEGSYGGRPDRDGWTRGLSDRNTNNPIEELEWRFPIRTERYRARNEPCAAGKWRGGIGMVRVNSCWSIPSSPARGSGTNPTSPGGSSAAWQGSMPPWCITRGGADEEAWPSKFTGFRLAAPATASRSRSNSGGYGDPLERDPALVLSDVFDGFTTIARARDHTAS